MARNAEKDINEYKKKYWNSKCTIGAFYYDDIQQVYEMSKGDLFNSINNALMFGFMVGYRRAKREGRGYGKAKEE